jgi:hypothetical protein
MIDYVANSRIVIEDKNGEKVIKKEINIFLKEMPTAYLGNLLWSITLSSTMIIQDYVVLWCIFYVLMTLAQVFLMMYAKCNPQRKLFYKLLIISASICFVTSIIKFVLSLNLSATST